VQEYFKKAWGRRIEYPNIIGIQVGSKVRRIEYPNIIDIQVGSQDRRIEYPNIIGIQVGKDRDEFSL
jgi:hypothetical protein